MKVYSLMELWANEDGWQIQGTIIGYYTTQDIAEKSRLNILAKRNNDKRYGYEIRSHYVSSLPDFS